MRDKRLRLLTGASQLAASFANGFEAIAGKPEFVEYFYHLDAEGREGVRRELLGYVTYAVAVLVGTEGYIRDPEELQLFMEEFISKTGCWDDALYERVDGYREADAKRGEALGSQSSIRFARLASAAITGEESEDGETLLCLTTLTTLFLVNYVSPVLSEAFYTGEQDPEEQRSTH